MTSSGGGGAKVVVDILKIHDDRMDFFENRFYVKIPEAREQIAAFELVLQDKGELTDAMANAVFKDHSLLRNFREKDKQRRKIANAEVDKATLAKLKEDGHMSEEGFKRIQADAKDHTNRLRRLKGKSASRLTPGELREIRGFLSKKKEWVRDVENQEEYIHYVFRSVNLIKEYAEETTRVNEYIMDQNQEMYARAIREASRHQITPGVIPQITFSDTREIVPVETEPECHDLEVFSAGTASTSLMSWIPQSDIYVRLSEIQAEYFALIGEDDPTGYSELQLTKAQRYNGHCLKCHVELAIDAVRAEQSCTSCGEVSRWNDNSLKVVPFGEPINPSKSKATYERKTYYEKWKKQVSGDLNSMVSVEDWAIIFKDCTEMGWDTVDKKMVKKILKKQDMSDYYDLIPVITNELNGIPLIKFSKEEEATLDAMFDEAMILFYECPWHVKQRSNYISYAYHFYQCCRMCGYDQYLNAFSLLTGDDNKKQHDRIWRWMCENKKGEPKWVFTPTF
jgi:hypothetical protein